jgi:hypothetical protein
MAKVGLLKNITKYIPLKQNAGIAIITLLLLIILFSIFNNSTIEGNTTVNPNAFNGKQKLEVIMWVDSSNSWSQLIPMTEHFNQIMIKYSGHALVVTDIQPCNKSEAYLKTCTAGMFPFKDAIKTDYETKWIVNCPFITFALFDSTKGDTIAKGGVRSLAGAIATEKDKNDITYDFIQNMIVILIRTYSIYPKPKVS